MIGSVYSDLIQNLWPQVWFRQFGADVNTNVFSTVLNPARPGLDAMWIYIYIYIVPCFIKWLLLFLEPARFTNFIRA